MTNPQNPVYFILGSDKPQLCLFPAHFSVCPIVNSFLFLAELYYRYHASIHFRYE